MSSSRDTSRTRGRLARRQVDTVVAASRALIALAATSVAGINEQVTLPQLRVLVMIDTEGPLNMAAVAAGLGVNPSNASRTCDRLVRAGLLGRQESPADRRNVKLTLTQRGQDEVSAIIERRRAAIEQVLRNMTAADRIALADSLDKFAQAAGEVIDHDALAMLWPDNH